MAKNIIALIEVDETTDEGAVIDYMYLIKGIENVRFTTLDSDADSGKKCLTMVEKILDNPAFAQRATFEKEEFECFKEDVRNVLEDEKPAPEISDVELLDIFDDFRDQLNDCDRHWEPYWDTLRDVLFEHGYEPDWEE